MVIEGLGQQSYGNTNWGDGLITDSKTLADQPKLSDPRPFFNVSTAACLLSQIACCDLTVLNSLIDENGTAVSGRSIERHCCSDLRQIVKTASGSNLQVRRLVSLTPAQHLVTAVDAGAPDQAIPQANHCRRPHLPTIHLQGACIPCVPRLAARWRCPCRMSICTRFR